VVARRMEEKTGLVAFGQGVQESTALALPDSLVEVVDLDVPL